jgi:hypothetical protein
MSKRAVLALIVLGLVLGACQAGAGASPSGAPSVADASPTMAPPSEAPGTDASTDASTDATESPTTEPSGPVALDSDPLHGVTLTDVRSGEEFTLGALAAEKPLLLETMAIWCTNCRAQQHNVVAAHELADFHSLSLDVEPGEQPSELAAYADREGFDWYFARADAQLAAQLRERFGTAVIVPPGMPKILFRTDGSIEFIGLGELYSAEQVAQAVGG